MLPDTDSSGCQALGCLMLPDTDFLGATSRCHCPTARTYSSGGGYGKTCGRRHYALGNGTWLAKKPQVTQTPTTRNCRGPLPAVAALIGTQHLLNPPSCVMQDMLRASARLMECHRGGQGAARGLNSWGEPPERDRAESGFVEEAGVGATVVAGRDSARAATLWQSLKQAYRVTDLGHEFGDASSRAGRRKQGGHGGWGGVGGCLPRVSSLRLPAPDSRHGIAQSFGLATEARESREEAEGVSAEGLAGVGVAESGASDSGGSESGGPLRVDLARGGREEGEGLETGGTPQGGFGGMGGSGLGRVFRAAEGAKGTRGEHAAWRAVASECVKVANRMCALVKQGESWEALQLFEPEILAKVGCMGLPALCCKALGAPQGVGGRAVERCGSGSSVICRVTLWHEFAWRRVEETADSLLKAFAGWKMQPVETLGNVDVLNPQGHESSGRIDGPLTTSLEPLLTPLSQRESGGQS